MEWVVIENNALASRNLGDCRTLSPEACGKAKELSQRILDKGLPSVEDMRGKLASCQDDSCRKGVWTAYRQASDATINTLKQMALNGELSREELAFINHEVGKELAVSGYRANDKLGRSEQSSWLNGGSGPLSGFFNTELRQKELENAGLSKTDAAQYVQEEQRNLLLLETAVGAIGGAASNKIQAKPSSVSSKSNVDKSVPAEATPVQPNQTANMGAKGNNASKGATGNISTFNPNEIRFSQNTVSYNKTERGSGVKYSYDDLVSGMKKDGWKGDPVDVVKMPDGKFTSMDNTRITAAREAGIDIKANVRSFDDKLTPAESIRFSDPRRGLEPKTWGEAITGRINKQTGGFSKNNPYGSDAPPRITGKSKD